MAPLPCRRAHERWLEGHFGFAGARLPPGRRTRVGGGDEQARAEGGPALMGLTLSM